MIQGRDVNLLLKDAEENPKKYSTRASSGGMYSHEPGTAQQEAILAELTEKMEVLHACAPPLCTLYSVAQGYTFMQSIGFVQVGVAYGAQHTPLQLTRCLVLRRMKVLQELYPKATAEQLVEALQFYSPESRLQDLTGFPSTQEDGQDGKWQTFQGELFYGSDQHFHDGVGAVVGDELSDSALENAVEMECLLEGRMEVSGVLSQASYIFIIDCVYSRTRSNPLPTGPVQPLVLQVLPCSAAAEL
jgi:hypothetical protein